VSEPARRPWYSFREYLLLEEASNTKHEYQGGQIYAMAGGTPEHAALAVSVSSALSQQLRGRGCRVYSSDLRVRVRETGLATYPDVTVICDQLERDSESADTATNPVVLVEVLSPSTAGYDRGEKLAHYKRIDSLREIVLVYHDEQRLEVWRRSGDVWTCAKAETGETVPLESIGCTLAVDEIYRNELSG